MVIFNVHVGHKTVYVGHKTVFYLDKIIGLLKAAILSFPDEIIVRFLLILQHLNWSLLCLAQRSRRLMR